MREEEKILQRYGRNDGFTVPEGYFDAFRKDMASRLSAEPVRREAPALSTWQKIRPYVYLAAMFAGIWCMMKMFHTMSTGSELTLDNLPESVALAMTDISPEITYYDGGENLADQQLVDALSEEYDNMEDFCRDFDYELQPRYADLSVIDK